MFLPHNVAEMTTTLQRVANWHNPGATLWARTDGEPYRLNLKPDLVMDFAKEYRILRAHMERGLEERVILKEDTAHIDRYCVYRIAVVNDAIARHQEAAPKVAPASQARPGAESSSTAGGVSSGRVSTGKVFLLQCMRKKLQRMLEDARARAAGRRKAGSPGSDKD